jgi:hypothetical protein
VSFIWFWTFWHWSKESFESGRLLRGPIHGIASHWDEWFRHEASPADRRTIEEVSRSIRSQRQYVLWLARRWSRDAHWRGARPPVRYVLGQLAHVAPFREWSALERYRASYGARGVSAVVIAEGSPGEATDVQSVEVFALPRDEDATAPAVLTDGFETDAATVGAARRAATSLLGGRGFAMFVALWIASGRRPYPRLARVALAAGWMTAAALIGLLLVGRDPGESLTTLAGSLAVLWLILVTSALAVATVTGFQAWRVARALRRRLEDSQIRLRMPGGLRLQGDSVGLPFCINLVAALGRAHVADVRRSWLWQRVHSVLRTDASSWTATGAIGEGGRVETVVLEPKLRACLEHPSVTNVLTPWQREGSQRNLDRLARGTPALGADKRGPPLASNTMLAFAASPRRLRAHRCAHVAQAIMAIGSLTSRTQIAGNAFALLVTVTMLAGLPGLKAILRPPPAPMVVAPSSPSPYYLWVSLDTPHPDDFYVVFESDFWANRRGIVARHGGANASTRTELRLTRLRRATTRNEEDGVIWIERRRQFLGRSFAPGARVGRYYFSYVNRLGHD